jgi:hypothetical protein
VRKRHNLECNHGQRIGVDGVALCLEAGLSVDAFVGFAIGRGGKEIYDCIEELLHALVLERRAAQHRIKYTVDGGFAN